jgi:hypothetical protein
MCVTYGTILNYSFEQDLQILCQKGRIRNRKNVAYPTDSGSTTVHISIFNERAVEGS